MASGMRTKRPLREPVRDAPGPKLKNYITPAGLQRLKDEHRFLMNRERPAVTQVVAWAASNGDRSENADYLYGKRRLRQIDSRIRFLTKRIDAAEVVDPAAPRPRIGCHARLLRGDRHLQGRQPGREHVVSIVGIDEVDVNRRYISWMSPLARALMKSSPGDRVVLLAPKKTEHLEILDVEYAAIPMDPFREPPGAEAALTRTRSAAPLWRQGRQRDPRRRVPRTPVVAPATSAYREGRRRLNTRARVSRRAATAVDRLG